MVEGCVESSALFLFVYIDFYKGRENKYFLVDVEY
jgi:hypothetical protein